MICKLKPYEWKYLCRILDKGYAILEALEMVRSDLVIKPYLEQGYDINRILLQGQKGRFYEHLSFFLSLSSISDAIAYALEMNSFEKALRKKLIKQTSYPILIFIMAFFTLYFFSTFIIPQMLESFDMQEENNILTTGVMLMQGTAQFIGIAIVLIALIGMYSLYKESFRLELLTFLNRRIHLPADICSYSLAGYLAQLQRHGLSTQKAFSFLCQVKPHTLLHTCVNQIDACLYQGMDITKALAKQPFVNASLLQCYRIGMHTQHMYDALLEMMQRQEEQWLRLLKQVSIIIQLFAYSFVAIMVLLVYQIMLVPLQILETM